MLLTITNRTYPASDLSYLLHKHPARLQSVSFSAGSAHIFYERADEEECTAVMLLDIVPVDLVKSAGTKRSEFALELYVNNRPYVASSFMSAAIAKAFSSALNGSCKEKPDLVEKTLSLEVMIAVLSVGGGEGILRRLFEPLGYSVKTEGHLLDPAFPEWGKSKYFTVVLKNDITMQQLLSHLYVLIPVCDNEKHYWISEQEIEKLLEKGKDWLNDHPEKEMIVMRYLKHQRFLANKALETLDERNEIEIGVERGVETPAKSDYDTNKISGIHDQRLISATNVLLDAGCKRVVDLGCGGGKLLKLLVAEKQFEYVLGMDVSYRFLEIAKERLKLDSLPEKQRQRIGLIHGSLTYRDRRIEGFDGAALIEVIEHLDQSRLATLERTVFEFAKPGVVVLTTPNAEYNVCFKDYEKGKMRHSDHRFEWTREQFRNWSEKVADGHGYKVSFSAVGEEHEDVGALSQMAVFKIKTLIEESLL